MLRKSNIPATAAYIAACLAVWFVAVIPHFATPRLSALLLAPAQATPDRIERMKANGANAVALSLVDGEAAAAKEAAARVQAAGLDLYYWIEIGRNAAMADAHPEWMASLQGHTKWRRHFPNTPQLKEGEVVKNYPWVPILYQEAFDAHLRRVAQLLEDQPAPKGIFLNDLQGAPSACGCGNNLCRWTADYGPIVTATRLGSDAAARFTAAVETLVPEGAVIPVWATECEEQDKESRCDGVGCFAGSCWRELTAQLMPLARQSETLAALLPHYALGRDEAWISRALASFAEMPPKRGGQPIQASRIVAILQGWDRTPAQIKQQIARSEQAGARGHVVSLIKIDQSWQPRLVQSPRSKIQSQAP